MIITKIMGGLGNQMFQYAYGKNLSNKFDTELYLDISFYDFQGNVKRKFSLNNFDIELNLDLEKIKNNQFYAVQDNFEYNELVYKNNYYIDGYWQSEKFFEQSKDEIRKIFSPNSNKVAEIYTKYPILQSNCVSLHVRRTDYTQLENIHPLQDIEYYKNAISIIDKYDYLLIISDDIEWCKNNLKFNNMIFIENNIDIDDMYIMSLCRNNIIANSSFSWWGAWLNNNINKKVIAPIKWFGKDFKLNTSNIIPDNWIKI